MRRGTPKASMSSMARGKAALEALVAKAMRAGSAIARSKRFSGRRANLAMGNRTNKRKAMSAT